MTKEKEGRQLVPGRTYRTRNNRVVMVTYIDDKAQLFPAHCRIEGINPPYEYTRYTTDGRYMTHRKPEERMGFDYLR